MKSTRQKSALCSLLLFFVVVAGFAGVAIAATTQQTIGYSWTIPSTRADGSALTVSEIAGYEITYTVDGGTPKTLAVNVGSNTSASVTLALAAKAAGYTLTSSMIAIDTNGLKSAPSATVTTKLTVQAALPTPPANFKLNVSCANGSCSLVVQ